VLSPFPCAAKAWRLTHPCHRGGAGWWVDNSGGAVNVVLLMSITETRSAWKCGGFDIPADRHMTRARPDTTIQGHEVNTESRKGIIITIIVKWESSQEPTEIIRICQFSSSRKSSGVYDELWRSICSLPRLYALGYDPATSRPFKSTMFTVEGSVERETIAESRL